jgi:hypothetical protein
MSGGLIPDGLASVYLGEFGESWVKAVAAGSGLLQGQAATLDFQKADIQITMVDGAVDPTVQVQVKTTEQPIDVDGDHARFSVDAATYNALRGANRVVRRVLAVIWVERDGGRVRLATDGTLLVGRAAWVSLEDLPETTNTTGVTVRVPLANTIDPDGLRRLLQQFGVPRSTPVASIDPWPDA